jgi:hypothetical protein
MIQQSSDQIDLLAKALIKVQREMKGAIKDSTNPFFKSKYADLESVWDACRDLLTKNDLCIVQTTGVDERMDICLNTHLIHASGQWIRGVLPICPKSNDPQGVGSAITYARRYGLAAIVGVIQVDDDGEKAMDRQSVVQRPVPGLAKNSCDQCGKTMMISKFNAGELYCGACGFKKPVAA